jgi:hypothetical protein
MSRAFLPIPDHLDSGLHMDVAYLQTTDGSTQTIVTIPMPENTSITVFAILAGSQNDESAGAGGSLMGVFRRAASNAAGVGTDTSSKEDDGAATPAVSMTTSTTNIVIQVAGVAAEAWDWVCGYLYVIKNL